MINYNKEVFIPDYIPKFNDNDLEQSFQKYNDLQVESQILIVLLLYSFSQFILLIFEYIVIISLSYVGLYLIIFRIIIAIVCLIGWYTIDQKWFNGIRIPLMFTYSIIGLIYCIMSILISHLYLIHDNLHECPYLFFWGSWSIGNSLIFSFMCFNTSGLLFSDATTISGMYTIVMTVLPFLLFPSSLPPLNLTIFLLPVFHFYEMLYVHSVEMETRTRYLNQLEAGRDLCRQDKLISSILPSDVSFALKLGNTNIGQLASYYPEVTILFCSIVDFTEHSSIIHPQDTVDLCRRIVSIFDRIVEQTGGYKVENIADTYMVCSGCPVKSLNHSLVMARTALAMMKAAETRCWRWPDSSPVQLKIGIHTGAVTAGVVGTKSYSYHLFGDAVNTASRMCSHSLPGKILLSNKTYQKLSSNYEDIFRMSERGEYQVKGKGMMKLYWLEEYLTHYGDIFAVNINRQSDKRAYTDRYAQLRESESVKISVNRYTLRFNEVQDGRKKPSSNNQSDPVSVILSDRRGSRVSREAAAAVSAGLTRLLSRGIESISPRSQYPTEEAMTGRIAANADPPNPPEKSRKFTSPVRKFESFLDEDESPPKKIEKEDSQEKDFSDEDIENKLDPPIPQPLPKIEIDDTNIVTQETVKTMEQSFQYYFDTKSSQIQFQTLIICAIYCFLNLVYKLIRNENWLYPLLRLIIFISVLIIAQYTKSFPKYSQKILLIIEILILITRHIEAKMTNDNIGAISISILFILFTTIFLRLRFHYTFIYTLVIIISTPISVYFRRNDMHHETPNYEILSIGYSFITLIAVLWLIYIQELTARTEFVDLFILRKEMLKSEKLLSNMLPSPENAIQLLKGERVLDELHDISLLYSDIKGFTPLSSQMHPIKLCELLNDIYSSFDKHLNEYGMYKVDIIGDAFVVIGGMPGYKDHANHAINTILFGFHMLEDIRNIRQKYNVDLEIRIGIHSGGCIGSVVSVNKPRYLIWGPNSNIANYLESTGIPGYIHISEYTLKKIDPEYFHMHGIEVVERGEIEDKKNLLNSEATYLLSCRDFNEYGAIGSGKTDSSASTNHQSSRFGQTLSQMGFKRFGGNRYRALTIDTTSPSNLANSGRIHFEGDSSRRERASSDPHGIRMKRTPDSPHSSMLQTAIMSSYFGGHSGRKSVSSVSTDSSLHHDGEHGTPQHSNNNTLRKRLDSNDSIGSNNSHNSSPRVTRQIKPFEENHVNFATSNYTLHEVTYNLPKGWTNVNSCCNNQN